MASQHSITEVIVKRFKVLLHPVKQMTLWNDTEEARKYSSYNALTVNTDTLQAMKVHTLTVTGRRLNNMFCVTNVSQ
jgi:hypothetical protein